jgi:crossover junction endodeoxyribonuclease RusA
MNLTLPYPPSVNTYWRAVRGRNILSKKAREYRVYGAIAVHLGAGNRQPITARLAVTIHAYMPDRRRRDLDNILKPLLDVMQHAGVYADDEQIDDLRVVRCGVEKPGRVEIEIKEIK